MHKNFVLQYHSSTKKDFEITYEPLLPTYRPFLKQQMHQAFQHEEHSKTTQK
jgi:predicted ATP-grasp superfamily ATP-dependent carboligase